MRLKHPILLYCAILCIATATAQPRLAVNIVVSGMRATDIDRYGANFGNGGFRRLTDGGAVFTECYADYAQTSTHSGAATLASGALPSVHGIVSRIWYDRTTNKPIELCKAAGNNQTLPYTGITDEYSNDCMLSQTLAEAVAAYSPTSRSITIAHTPQSAILTAGRSGECYWLDERGSWSSAKCYAEELPSWVRAYNDDAYNNIFAGYQWYGKYTKERYRNSRSSVVALYDNDSKAKRPATKPTASRNAVANILTTPAGSPAIFEFAKRAISALCPLKADERKVLNIYIDASRAIVERFGSDSAEYEDMLYCLDDTLADFLTFLYAQTDHAEQIVVTLASDHGTSRTIDAAQHDERFNAQQFEVIVNAFLSARHGQDEWVLGYCDNALYLNRDIIYKHRKTVADIQTETASFALQFRGISHAVSATAMQNGYFGSGIAHLMQNGFYPRRSGDVLVCLMPERIESIDDTVSCSGSPYNYDRHVPLIIYGGGIAPQRIDKRTDTTSIAPTVARLLGAERPATSTAETITDLKTE